MVAHSWRGRWWLPDSEQALPGTLYQSEGGRFRLELVGRLRAPHSDGFMVLGDTLDGPVTLLDCLQARTSRGRVDIQDISVGIWLGGVHLEAPDDAVFTSTTVQIEYLRGWLGAETAITVTIDEDSDLRWDGQQRATTSPMPAHVLKHGGFEYTLSTDYDQFTFEHRARANALHLRTKEWGFVTIKSPVPLPYGRFQPVVKTLMDLLTLATNEPAGVLHETLTFRTKDERRLQWGVEEEVAELRARQTHQPAEGPDEGKRIEYLFTLDDVDPTTLLPRWIDLHEQAWLACGMLFGLRYIPGGYTQSRLMTSVTVLEALHRELHTNATALPPTQFDDMIKRILTALAGDDPDSKAERRYVREYLQNRLSCRQRLIALAGIPDQEAVRALISDVPRWATAVRDARDGVAHASAERLTTELAGNGHYALQVNMMLASLVLMEVIGVPAEVQRRAARSQHVWYAAEKFNESLENS